MATSLDILLDVAELGNTHAWSDDKDQTYLHSLWKLCPAWSALFVRLVHVEESRTGSQLPRRPRLRERSQAAMKISSQTPPIALSYCTRLLDGRAPGRTRSRQPEFLLSVVSSHRRISFLSPQPSSFFPIVKDVQSIPSRIGLRLLTSVCHTRHG